MQILNTNTIQVDTVVQTRTVYQFLEFQFIDTKRETQFLKAFRNHTMLISPPTFGTYRGV